MRSLSLTLLAATVVAFDCGPGIGSCPSGSCCSGSNWCGTSSDYCKSPQCQLAYSDSCDTYSSPPGDSTLSVARPKLGSVPYGTLIQSCTTPGTVALTFDDGPYTYTSQLLDLLSSLNVKATFMIVGNNLGKGHIDDPSKPWGSMLKSMYAAGHQLASHSWSHEDWSVVNTSIQQSQVIYNEMAFRNLFGFFPTYWRCPYLACGTSELATLGSLGYHVVDINIDTKDYLYDSASLIQQSKDRFSTGLSTDPTKAGYIPLAHDIHYQTVVNLTGYMIQTLQSRGYRAVTIGECLGDPKENWYRSSPGGVGTYPNNSPTPSSTFTTLSTSSTSSIARATSSTPASTLKVSTNQSCGSTTGFTCQGSKYGNCCSFYGFCGSTASYCGAGCQGSAGSCDKVVSGSVTPNGLCGINFGTTCTGYAPGGISKGCCSASGYCGNTSAYCGTGCQSRFGTCG